MLWSPAVTVTFMYEPMIRINEDLMDTLSLEEKRSWVEISLTKVFDIDSIRPLPSRSVVFVLLKKNGNSNLLFFLHLCL
jgi:hypothetical protein